MVASGFHLAFTCRSHLFFATTPPAVLLLAGSCRRSLLVLPQGRITIPIGRFHLKITSLITLPLSSRIVTKDVERGSILCCCSRWVLTFHQILSGIRQKRYDGTMPVTRVGDQHSQMAMPGPPWNVEEPQTANTTDLGADDIVIAYVIKLKASGKMSDSMLSSVIGPTGSGKSTVR